MDKRLFRNEHDKVVAGVSSGIAEYMEVDVTIIRLLFVLSTIFLVGTGVLVYIVMWIVVPVNNDPTLRFSKFNDYFKGQSNNPFSTPGSFSQPQPKTENPTPASNWTSSTINEGPFQASPKMEEFNKPFPKTNNETGRTVGGLFLLVIGIYFLMNEFNIIPFWFSLGKLWPLVFVAIGASFIMKGKNKNAWENWKEQQERNFAGNPVNPTGAAETPVEPVSPLSTDVENNTNPSTPDTGEGTVPPADDRFTKHD
ncbi:PspC domain-containing protein [Pedobacter gandavensis]|uniref:PspC domain-containing protein n=1 Tax=Pedobacter gandavensis TaxID=2679963 RepID=A0ABR6F4Y9_9SPHI|nr:PspC domain-containing protein [Pedobacter gandavensis]MBB2151768.1 PspC domain-containing protein [Pedobacter gandavensis]